MSKLSYKKYLEEYYRYFNSFSEVIDKEEDGLTKAQDDDTAEVRKVKDNERECEDAERGDGEEDYDPCKFRQWMEISIAGEN